MGKIDWKQISREALFILGLTSFVAVIYNYLNPSGITLFKKPAIVSDTILEKLLSDTISNVTPKETASKKDIKKLDTTTFTLKDTTNVKKATKIEEKQVAETIPQKRSDEIPIVTYNQLIKYLESPNLILIDARSPDEYHKAHIGNAINIFAYEQDLNLYFQKIATLPKDPNKVIIVYCEGGSCDASHKVSHDLIHLGHKNVFIYPGGWDEWTKLRKNANE